MLIGSPLQTMKIGRQPMTTPTSRFSTVGGRAATGGMGVEGFRYGAFREAVVESRVVTETKGPLEIDGDDELLGQILGSEARALIITLSSDRRALRQ